MKRRTVIALLTVAAVASACSFRQQEVVEYPEEVNAMIFDDSSDIFVDFNAFPEDMHRLDIGIICRWADYTSALENIRDLDEYDNITGAVGKDGIPDFAGEHFTFIVIRDSLESKSALTGQVMRCAAGLLSGSFEENGKERSKAVIIGSYDLSVTCMPLLEQALAISGTKVTATGVDEFTSRKAAAMTCYNTLRQQHNLALRTTPQVVGLIVEPPFEFELFPSETELSELDTLECIPLP